MKDKEKLKQFQREWLAKRKNDFFADKCCAVCGSKQDLQLSRLGTGPSLRGIWSLSPERRAEVAAECRILCPTHAKEAYSEKRGSKVVHGTAWMYQKHGCRCPACVEAASKARQAWRDKNPDWRERRHAEKEGRR